MPSDGVRLVVAVVDGFNHRGGLTDGGGRSGLAVLANRGPLRAVSVEGRWTFGTVPSTAPRVAWVLMTKPIGDVVEERDHLHLSAYIEKQSICCTTCFQPGFHMTSTNDA